MKNTNFVSERDHSKKGNGDNQENTQKDRRILAAARH